MSTALARGPIVSWTRRLILDPVLRLIIGIETSLTDARFVRRQQLPTTFPSRVLFYPAVAIQRLGHVLGDRRQDLLFDRYADLHLLHYGPQGRGYQSISRFNPHEQLQRYTEQTSRLEYFIDHFPELLCFRDGDSFLEFGCGTGQNIRVLADRYSSSSITGYDLNQDAVDLVRHCEGHTKLELATGDVTDDGFRSAALADGVDHVILSHIFSLLIGRSRSATEEIRRKVLRDVVAACRSSIVLLDVIGAEKRPKIRIEQRQRAIVSDDLFGYFSNFENGRTYMVQSDKTRAIIFIKGSGEPPGTDKLPVEESASER